jgi:hypothetical protein
VEWMLLWWKEQRRGAIQMVGSGMANRHRFALVAFALEMMRHRLDLVLVGMRNHHAANLFT